MDETVSIILFSGTDDKLASAAVLAAGAAALGKPVKIFLQYWALDAFRKDRIAPDRHGLCPEAGAAGKAAVAEALKLGKGDWVATLQAAKELGEVDIQACSLSMEIFHLEPSDLDRMVDGIQGVAAFFINAGEGQVIFI